MLQRWTGTILVILYGAVGMASGQLGQLKLAIKPTDLLNGRLTVRVPVQGKSHAIEHSIMSAPDAVSESTRIMIDSGPQRMVLVAYELFARTDQGFEQGVRKESAKGTAKVQVEAWPLPAPLRGFACFPITPTHDQEANLVMILYVAQADGTVQQVAFFINQSAAKEFNAATVLARSMAKTIAAGPQGLSSAAGDRELSAYSPGNAIFATVPEGYVATLQQGPDFTVHHLRKLVPFGETAESLGLYLGYYPSSNREGFKEAGNSVFFGKQAQWYEKESTENGATAYFTSAIVPVSGPNTQATPRENSMPLLADVFLFAGTHAGIEELKKVAATLRIGALKPKK